MASRRQFLSSIAPALSVSLLGTVSPAGAQTVQKLTRLIIGTPPGGYPDTVARLLINNMKSYASTIILENKPGAGQRIALEALKNSAADGATMMLSPAGPNVLYPHIYKKLGYKPFEDFIPVTTVFDTPSSLVVGPMVPPQVKTVADFTGWCRANPTQSAYGTPGAGSPMHFLGAMLADAAGFKYLHVPYQGSGPATQDVLSGQIASAIVPVPAVVQLSEPGRLRVLATTGPERSTSLPDTYHEGGRLSRLGVLGMVRNFASDKDRHGDCHLAERSCSQCHEDRRVQEWIGEIVTGARGKLDERFCPTNAR